MCLLSQKCPIPIDQQPLNEYLSLKDSWLFSISTCELNIYIKYIVRIYLILLSSLCLIIFTIQSLVNFMNIVKLICLDCLIVEIILVFFFIRLYLGWSYVCKRLLSATVFYEESGWYDGQIYIKTSEMLIQDRLIGLYEVSPLIERVKYTCLLFFIMFVVHFAFYSLL